MQTDAKALYIYHTLYVCGVGGVCGVCGGGCVKE